MFLAVLAISPAPYLAVGTESLLAYLFLVFATLLPAAIWIQKGMGGIPIWPAVALMSFVYFAIPILRDKQAQTLYSEDDVLRLALTVGGFLIAGTVGWWVLLAKSIPATSHELQRPLSPRQVNAVIYLGLGSGALYLTMLNSGVLGILGPFFGLVRSAMLTATIVASFMVGYARGRSLLRGQTWALAVAAIAINVLLALGSLFLVGGLSYLLAAVAGYALVAKRVPWRALMAGLVVFTVLHAGKAEMRKAYWLAETNSNAQLSILNLPRLITEWVTGGLNALLTGADGDTFVDRASQFQLLLRVQSLAPEQISFLNGETYSLLPSLLVPRFVAPDKITSQTGMATLNVHFGFQTREAAQTTAIGWGLVAEGYANFGYLGAIGVGLFAGLLAGLFSRWSGGADPISLSTFLGIIALMSMINLEADLSYLLVTLWQSCISAAGFFLTLRLFQGKRRNGRARPLTATKKCGL